MKYFTLVLILFSLNVFAGFPPTTIKGDKTSKKETFFDLEVPNKQATKISANKYRIETGNGNMIPDPSFESGVTPTPSFPVNAGDISYECSTAPSVIADPIANDGTKVLKMDYGTGTGINTKRCELYVKIPDNMIGTEVEFSFTGSIKNNSLVCIRSTQTVSPFNLQEGECKNYYDSVADKNKSYVFSIKPLYNVVYLGFYRDSDTDTTTNREARLDTIYFGKPKSDEAIVAKFDNTTEWVPCTFSTLAWGGYGTVTNNLECKRDKDSLKIKGNFVNGTVSGSTLAVPMPTNFGSINAVKKSANYSIGNNLRVTASQFVFQNFFINTTAGDNSIYSSTSIISASANPMVSVVGTGNVANGERIAINGELTIPIAEWSSQTNAAIVACKEGPLKCTNTLVFKRFSPDLFAIDQFGNSYPVTKGANTGYSILNLSSLSLANPMICTATLSGGSNFFGWTTILNPTTNTAATVYTVNGSGTAAVDAGFNISCTKTGSDYNEAYDRIVIQKDNADIRSTEWLTGGYDYISNKPIYKRCHKVASNVTTDNTTLATWVSGLNPLAPEDGVVAGLFQLENTSVSDTSFTGVLYNKTSGIIRTWISSGTTLRAGQTLCLKYTK